MGVDSSLNIFLIDEEITIYLFVDVVIYSTISVQYMHLPPQHDELPLLRLFSLQLWDGKGLKFLFPNIVLCKFYIDLLITDVKCELFQELHI